MKGGPLVVVGDVLLDVDLHGTAGRVAPDAPVPVVDCHRERHRAGGAGLAAVLAAGLGGSDVVLITALGQDRPGSRLSDLLCPYVQVIPLPLDGGTPCKIRVQASGHPVVRLDAGDGRARPGPLSPQAERALRRAGAVLVSDYGRGMAAHPALTAMLARLTAATPVVRDPHPAGGRPLPGSRLVTPSQAEARRFAAAPGRRLERCRCPRLRAGQRVPRRRGAEPGLGLRGRRHPGRGRRAAVHRGGRAVPRPRRCHPRVAGLLRGRRLLRRRGGPGAAVRRAAHRGSDRGRAPGHALPAAGRASAAPGSTIPGNTRQAQPGPPGPAGDTDAWRMVTEVRAHGGRIVATGGCFDLLHAGHVGLLRQARKLGDCLVVCLNSDSSVRAPKGREDHWCAPRTGLGC